MGSISPSAARPPAKERCNDGVLTEDRLRFQSFRLVKKAELNSQAVWECYNVRLTEAE